MAAREGGNDNDDRRRHKNDKGCKKNKHKGKGQSKALPSALYNGNLPDDLFSRLPPTQEGDDRIIAGYDVMLVGGSTGFTLDILRDVMTH